jgi:epoxyqueuosine reductase
MASHDNSYNHLADLIIQKALALGFDDCSFSPTNRLDEDAEKVENWLKDGFHGEMGYMERNREKRYDPRKLVENTKTIVTVLFNYFPEEKLVESNNYKIAKYAYGKDYHLVIRERLQELVTFIEEFTGKLETRVFTDSAPILDRAWAEKSGLGFIGKNTCLIHPKKGSFFFIGHAFLPVRIEKEIIPVTDYCGTCTRCIDACPTGALAETHRLDARKCISYLTIEHKGDLPEKLKPQFHNWIFGCDICQDVCPWNRFSTPHKELLFTLSDNLKAMRKKDWDHLSKEKFDQLFKKSAIKRTKYTGLHRNISFLSNKEK